MAVEIVPTPRTWTVRRVPGGIALAYVYGDWPGGRFGMDADEAWQLFAQLGRYHGVDEAALKTLALGHPPKKPPC